jgi:hypothetical protein
MTRAKQHLYLVQPIKFFRSLQHRYGNGHIFAPRSQFLSDDILPLVTRTAAPMAVLAENTPAPQTAVSLDIGARLRGMWADLRGRPLSGANPIQGFNLRHYEAHCHRKGSRVTGADSPYQEGGG